MERNVGRWQVVLADVRLGVCRSLDWCTLSVVGILPEISALVPKGILKRGEGRRRVVERQKGSKSCAAGCRRCGRWSCLNQRFTDGARVPEDEQGQKTYRQGRLSSAKSLYLNETASGRGYVMLAPYMAYPVQRTVTTGSRSGGGVHYLLRRDQLLRQSNRGLAPLYSGGGLPLSKHKVRKERTYWRRQAGSEHLNRALPLVGVTKRAATQSYLQFVLQMLLASKTTSMLEQRIRSIQAK